MSEIEKQEAKGRKRNVQINIRISEAEAEQLRKKVEQSGMSQQEYILSCVLNKPNSPATKVRIKDLGLPEDTIIGGIVRGDKVFIAVDNMEIIPYDRVVVFAMPGSVGKVGYYFN